MFAIAATIVGNALSYRRREHPWRAVKPILAACVVGGFVWFIITATRSATPGDISTVEAPLAALFAWVLSTHSFDVPARRDVAYSLAGSAALMAVAAAQTVDLSLGIYVVAWLVCGLWGLVSMWQSMSGADGVPWRTLAAAGLVVAVLTVALVSLLPAPHVSTSLIFPSSSAGSPPVESPSNLTDGGAAGLPAHAASPTGKTGVGGFLGFAKSLDTGVRATLGDQVVMRVRATRPAFWVGQTYDTWDGQSWAQSTNPTDGPAVQKLTSGSPFDIPLANDQQAGLSPATTDIQTFYLAQSGPNLVFHADNAQKVYVQAQHLLVTNDGTIVSGTSMGSGTVYTVVSADSTATASQLAAATATGPGGTPPVTLPTDQQRRYLQLPHPDARVAALAQQITAGIDTPGGSDPHTQAKVSAIEAWMSSHIHYSTDIPPLQANQDAVIVPVRLPGSASASRSPRPPRSCSAPWASRPARWSGTSPAPTTRSPTSTRWRPTTPTPGSRSGSPATAGRISIRPPTCRRPTRPPVRSSPPAPPTSSAVFPGSPSVRSWSSSPPSSGSGGGASADPRPGPTGSPASWNGPVPGRASSAGPTRPWSPIAAAGRCGLPAPVIGCN